MTYEIEGSTGAEHAEFFGPEWYDNDDEPTDEELYQQYLARMEQDAI